MTVPPATVLDLPEGPATFRRSDRPGTAPVLLLHGGGLDRASLSWRHLFPVLAARRTVVAPDWPGYGGSTPFGRPYTIADLGRWLIGLMDRLDIDHADMVGVSMGGGAALWTAVNHPDRVGRLVPVATYGVQQTAPYHLLSYLAAHLPLNTLSYAVLRRSRWATRRALQAIFADPKSVAEQLVDEVQDVLTDGAVGKVFTQFQRGEIRLRRLRTVVTPDLGKVAQPTLFVHGKADTLVPLRDVRRAAERMPAADLKILEAGHWPMREAPAAFNAAVEAFLEGGCGGSAAPASPDEPQANV